MFTFYSTLVQEYEAVEFSNDDPVVSKALKKRRVSAVRVVWGAEPTDFMSPGLH